MQMLSARAGSAVVDDGLDGGDLGSGTQLLSFVHSGSERNDRADWEVRAG